MKKRGLVLSSVSGFLALFSATLFVAALVWASDPPWKGKPYQQWDDKDVERVFADSPWARATTITRTWVPISEKDLPNDTVAGRDRALPATLDRSSETSVGGELNLYVYWASSRVMRAASARKAILHGGKKDVNVEKYASEPQEEYQIVLQSKDMSPFFRHDEKFFQSNAFLEAKKSKQKMSPSHIRYERDEKGILVTTAIFFFPKKTPSGDPTIIPDEKGVEFTCKIEGSTLRVRFEPQKMADQSGPDL
jgi:hypothetical protein